MAGARVKAMETFDRPKPSGFLIAVTKMLLPAILRIRHGDTEINVVGDGLERFKDLKGKRAIVCPNHPSWDDSDMVFAFSNLVGENFNYMTAWEVLHHHFGYRTWLQHIGCFSVIRGLPDRASFKAMRDILVAGKNKVVVFPEGEISHDSCNLLPLKAGMIQIAFSALQKLERENCSETIFLVPLALKYKFKDDPSPRLHKALSEMEQVLKMPEGSGQSLPARINAVSQAVVKKLEKEYGLQDAPDMFLDNRIDRLRSKILAHVAGELSITLPPEKSHLELAHILQSTLYARVYASHPATRAAHHQPEESPAAAQFLPDITEKNKVRLRSLARDLHRVVDFVSIYEGYASPQSSLERLAEIIDLLEAEVLQRRIPKGAKRVSIYVGTPIDLSSFYYKYKTNKIEAEDLVLTIYKDQMKAMIGVY